MPVLIVGGGPIGLSMAIGLRHLGVECVVVERHDSTLRNFPKGRAVQARSMEIFDSGASRIGFVTSAWRPPV